MRPSRQLATYLRARRGGASRDDAAALADISIEEADLSDADEARGLLADLDITEAPAPIGHNSKEQEMNIAELDQLEKRLDASIGKADSGASIAAQELRLFVERVERLEEEKKGIAGDIKDVMSEMKGRGYDTKIVRKILAIRKKKKGEHEEEAMILETYMAALGMI